MIFNIPVTWAVCATMKVEAQTLEEAQAKSDDLPLPTDPDYIDGSFRIDLDLIEQMNPDAFPSTSLDVDKKLDYKTEV